MFTLAISCLITSNLHWFMDLTSLSSYAMLLFTASNFTSITHHIHSWVLFLLWLHLFILFGVISSLSPVSYWAPTDLGSSSFSVLSFCLFILFVGFSSKNTEVICHSLLQNSPPWPVLDRSLRQNVVDLTVNKRFRNAVLGCNFKKDRMISVHFQG